MGKEKKDKKAKSTDMETDDEPVVRYLCPIAKPLAEKKLSKKLYKTVKKATKVKHVRRGVKEVTKSLGKGEKGLVLIAGDISPMDVMSHIPVLCEDHDVPYIFVPSKDSLGEASSTKRPTSVAMVVFGGKQNDKKAAEDYEEIYTECLSQVKKIQANTVYD